MGAVGPRGIPGVKGDVGPIGRPGEKGSIGLKGIKGNRGYTGLQGPKGECIADPKISIYPVSQEVFGNTPAIFYCWVDGQTSKQITWSRLGGALLKDTIVKDGALHINNVRRSHVGSYMCTVHTGHGILKAISRLRLKEPPFITNGPPSEVSVVQGSTLALCCGARGSPSPTVQWSRVQQSPDTTLTFQQTGCLNLNPAKYNSDGVYSCQARNRFGVAETRTKVTVIVKTASSCQEVLKSADQEVPDGEYLLIHGKVYCDMTGGQGWSLIARFSNNDNKNWMRDDGSWWYDRHVAMGTTANPFINADMISPAFWLVNGREFKITRSDDPSHTPLLETTGNCLAGQTFRSKITSYGDFRNGKVWASDKCLGSCTVQYGGQYKSTDGFQQAKCSGNIQSANNIGFWCDWSTGDGSAMMIGGGGNGCERADHGIGITEADAASFAFSQSCTGASEFEHDFGYGRSVGVCSTQSQAYSLNLWIR